MRAIAKIFSVPSLIDRREVKPTIILLLSALLLTIHRYFGSIEFFESNFALGSSFPPVFFMFFSAFILLGCLPLVIIYNIFRESLNSYGVQLGDWKFGLRMIAILFPVIALGMLLPAAFTEEMRNFYPFDSEAKDSMFSFIRLEVARGVLFYTAWEFFFRGFMLFGLKNYVGQWLAICIQTIPSCLWHIGMPTGEIFSSIAGGILFGVIAIRTQSLLWPLLLHYLIGVGLDFFIIIID